MKYAEIRQHVAAHFREQLERFKAGISESGPIQGDRKDALTASQGLTEADPSSWAGMVHPECATGLLREF